MMTTRPTVSTAVRLPPFRRLRNIVQDRGAALCECAAARVRASSQHPMEDLKGPSAMFSTIATCKATATAATIVFAGAQARFAQAHGRWPMRHDGPANRRRASVRHHRRCEPPAGLDRTAA